MITIKHLIKQFLLKHVSGRGRGGGGARECFFFFFSRPKLPRTYYGFQDIVFGTWDLNFGAWEVLGYGFQDMVFKTWDLNFETWISHRGFTVAFGHGHPLVREEINKQWLQICEGRRCILTMMMRLGTFLLLQSKVIITI
jgi:hypothetical protein